MDEEHFGFFIDAVDSQKFGIPTTASQAMPPFTLFKAQIKFGPISNGFLPLAID